MEQSTARMARDATVVDSWTTLREAVTLMNTLGLRVLLVCRNGSAIGAVADGDVAGRLAEQGKEHGVAPEQAARTQYCFPDVSLGQALGRMEENEVCRLRVITRSRVCLEALAFHGIAGA